MGARRVPSRARQLPLTGGGEQVEGSVADGEMAVADSTTAASDD